MFGLFGSVAHELHFCVCAGYRLLICYGPLPVFFFTASKLQFRHRVEGLRTHRFWLARARLVYSDPLPAVSAPCGRVANAPFLAAFFLACVLHALGTKLAAVRGFRKLRIGAFCLAWARILLLFGRFAWAPSRHHGTSADGLAWALLSAPPRHLALRYTGFGPSLAARVLATRHVLWIPKVTGSIFSGLCFWLA